MLQTLYEALSNRLQTATDARWIDLWDNQLQRIERINPLPYPWLFIALERIDWETMGRGVQRGTAQLTVHVVQKAMPTARVGGTQQREAMARLAYLESVHAALNGLSGPQFNSLERVATEWDEDTEVARHDMLRYTTRVEDPSQAPALAAVHPWQETVTGTYVPPGGVVQV